MPLPVGAVIVIVPVGVPHVGWALTVAVGCAGEEGALFTTSPARDVDDPQALLDVTE